MQRKVFSLAAGALLTLGAVLAAPARAAAPTLGAYYLAVGDGYAQGYLTVGLPADPQCNASDAPGYVCIFYRYLKQVRPALQVQNFGEEGADSCELVGAGHRCYSSVLTANPVDAAVQFIQAHPGQVSPISVSLGGSDLLPLLQTGLADPVGTAAQLPKVLGRLQSNVDAILGRLRSAAGSQAQIIVTTQVNPLDGVPSPPLPAGIPELGANAIDAVNQAITAGAAGHDVVLADVAAAFHSYPSGPASLTWVATSLASGDASKLNPYPTAEGYRLMADTIIKASDYLVPLTVTATLGSKAVVAGRSEKVKGRTTLESSLQATIQYPSKRKSTYSVPTSASGSYAMSFKVGKTRGRGWVTMCATDLSNRTKCSSKLAFTVR
jgi:hypothetical protein